MTDTARIFNSALCAGAIASAFELGVLDELRERNAMCVRTFCRKRDLHIGSVQAILRTLACFDIVDLSPDRNQAVPGTGFEDTFRDKGYFMWLVRGYGKMMQRLPSIIQDGAPNTENVGRDAYYIALAGSDYGRTFVDDHFKAMLDEQAFRVAADFGCGSAVRLIELAERRPDFRGIGVEISSQAVSLARRSIAKADLQERLHIVQCDVTQLRRQPEFEEVEVLFCFFMGHELWPRAHCLQTLRDMKAAFPNAGRFLFCDTYRSELAPGVAPPMFTLGYEFTHAVMGHYIPTRSEWLSVFDEAGWQCIGQRDIGIPFSTIFDLRRAST